jgi:hypothetical protein
VVYFEDISLKDEIESELIFDELVTAHDRLQLINIPNDTNASNMAIKLFKMTIGSTRDQHYFTRTEAYCCNIFTINKVISKITFSFSNPENLIELYQ